MMSLKNSDNAFPFRRVPGETSTHILFQSLCYNFKDSWQEVVFVKMYLCAFKS